MKIVVLTHSHVVINLYGFLAKFKRRNFEKCTGPCFLAITI